MRKINVAIYSRKSRFVEGSESIENQIEMCKEYINKNFKNINDILIYEDEGFSGGNIERPQFSKMIKDAKNKMFDVIICYRLDRISRNIADFTSIITQLQELDIDFISIKEQFDTSSPMGRAMMYISSVFAQLERETIAERIKDNLLELSKTGKWLGGNVPFGYIKKGEKKDAVLDVDNKYADTVKKIFNKYIEFNSLSQVASWSIENNIKTRNNKYFNTTTLKVILSNPVYCVGDINFYNYAKQNKMQIFNTLDEFKNNTEFGIMCYNKFDQSHKTKQVQKEMSEWIVALGKHKALIDSELFITIQERLKENAERFPRAGQAQEALLSGLIRCVQCGGWFITSSYYKEGKRKGHHYRCSTKVRSKKLLCDIKNISGYKADDKIIEKLKKLGNDDELIKNMFGEHKNELNNNDLINNIEACEKQINEYKSNINKLTEKLISIENSAASKYIVEKIESFDAEIKELNKRIVSLKSSQNENKIKQINLEIFKDSVHYLTNSIDTLSIDEQKRILKNLIKVIYWDGQDLKIVPRI